MKLIIQSLLVVICLLRTTYGQFANFVTVRGDSLMDGDQELRFISVNVPNLHYIEDYLPFNGTNPWRLPDEFEIRDALTAVKQLGGKVARIYVFSVRRQDDAPGIIRHVEGPGRFNEEAFKTFDKVLQVANEIGIRLIIPFVDNWRWWGGVREYAEFRCKSRNDFWTDPELIDDLKKTIGFVINRTNTCTGVPYKQDKAILAWETGNELSAPFSWTREIAAYVKSLDSNHLLLEGTNAKNLTQDALDDPHLDILSSHHYRNPRVSQEAITENRRMAKGKKPYIVGEYGIIPTEDIRILTDTIINQGVSGGMIWSLRTRNREGGFYHHYEYSNVEAYHWPGFPDGAFYDEKAVMSLLREKAHQIDNTPPMPVPVPSPPILLGIKNAGEISWQGSAGATSYRVERREAEDTLWRVIADSVDEARFQYRPLFNDESAITGKQYFYRVSARSESGVSACSNIVGPVDVKEKIFFDEMLNYDNVFQKEGDLELLTFQAIRESREDCSRLTGSDDSYIVYKVQPAIMDFKADIFLTERGSKVLLSASTDMTTFSDLTMNTETYDIGTNDYGFYITEACRVDSIPPGTKYIKVVLENNVQIGRIEYRYK